jgi:hydrogenase expression/formation protein HypE
VCATAVFARHAAADGEGRVGLAALDDGAALRIGDRWLVYTTDTHVVNPAFFPGGDIGRLAVSGTVNDLAVMGATEPLGLACAVVLEEGFERERLLRKVMGRGELDGIVITTTGLGFAERLVRDDGLRAGDDIVVTGAIGEHGFAVLAERNDLRLVGDLRSDVAPLNGLLALGLEAGGEAVVAMKDPTRGGVASALHEMAGKSGVGVLLEEARLPVRAPVRSVSELVGIDVLHVANEGVALVGVRPEETKRVVEALRGHPRGRDARRVGVCTRERPGQVVLDTGFGRRLVAEPEGELLPRIC